MTKYKREQRSRSLRDRVIVAVAGAEDAVGEAEEEEGDEEVLRALPLVRRLRIRAGRAMVVQLVALIKETRETIEIEAGEEGGAAGVEDVAEEEEEAEVDVVAKVLGLPMEPVVTRMCTPIHTCRRSLDLLRQ